MKNQQNRIELVTRPAFQQHWLVDVATTWSRFSICGSGDYWQHTRKRFIWLGRGNSADWKECLKGMHSFNTFAFTFVFAICRKSYWMVKLQDYGNWSSIFFFCRYPISPWLVQFSFPWWLRGVARSNLTFTFLTNPTLARLILMSTVDVGAVVNTTAGHVVQFLETQLIQGVDAIKVKTQHSSPICNECQTE